MGISSALCIIALIEGSKVYDAGGILGDYKPCNLVPRQLYPFTCVAARWCPGGLYSLDTDTVLGICWLKIVHHSKRNLMIRLLPIKCEFLANIIRDECLLMLFSHIIPTGGYVFRMQCFQAVIFMLRGISS